MKIMKRYIQVIFICWLSINSITEVYGKDPIGISLVNGVFVHRLLYYVIWQKKTEL